jgi:protein tyrosine/serine phosphatase
LGVEEDWQAVTHYLYCELIVPGRPIEEIKSEISKLDSSVFWEDLEDPSITIAFEDRYLQIAEGSIYILLNEDNEVRAVSRNVRDDFVAIDCPVLK